MDSKPDKQFFELADRFIALANESTRSMPIPRVSAAQMYAAARFNTFAVVTVAPSPEAAQDEAVPYLVAQYELMCQENIQEQIRLRWTPVAGGV